MTHFANIDLLLRRVVGALENEESRWKRQRRQIESALPILEKRAASGDATAAELLAEARAALAEEFPAWMIWSIPPATPAPAAGEAAP